MQIKNVVYKLKEIYRKLSVPQFTIVTGLIIIFFGTLILSSPLCSTSDEEHKGELRIKVPKKIIINPVTIVN